MSAGCRKAILAALIGAMLPAPIWAQNIDISGFLTLEMEWHHNEGADSRVWWEINRLRLDFSSQLSQHSSILTEFAPVPEEITHQIEHLTLSDGRELPLEDTTSDVTEDQDMIPFERIELRVERVAGRALNLSLGQLRNPFGHWEDFSAHRNATLTKNNRFVLGIALRNLDMGIQADANPVDWLSYRLGIRKGSNVSTVDLGREDNNKRLDAVARVGSHVGALRFGLNGYAVDSRTEKYAVGIDWMATFPTLSLMGEGVLQKNTLDGLQSQATYVQANYHMAHVVTGLRCYLLCEYWRLEADSRLEREAWNLIGGVKFKVLPRGLTLILESGRTYIHGAPDPWHVTAQTEIEF